MNEPLSRPTYKLARVSFRPLSEEAPLFNGDPNDLTLRLMSPFYSPDIPAEFWNWTLLAEVVSPLEVGSSQELACECLIRPLGDEALPFFVQGFKGHFLGRPVMPDKDLIIRADFEVLAERFPLHPNTVIDFFDCVLAAPPSQLDPKLREGLVAFPFREKPMAEAADYLQALVDNNHVGSTVRALCNLKRQYVW